MIHIFSTREVVLMRKRVLTILSPVTDLNGNMYVYTSTKIGMLPRWSILRRQHAWIALQAERYAQGDIHYAERGLGSRKTQSYSAPSFPPGTGHRLGDVFRPGSRYESYVELEHASIESLADRRSTSLPDFCEGRLYALRFSQRMFWLVLYSSPGRLRRTVHVGSSMPTSRRGGRRGGTVLLRSRPSQWAVP